MIVRRLAELIGTDRHTQAETWESRRFLLEKDGLGFSMHDTIIHAGTETVMWYRHHLEAVYCIEGKGELQVLPAGPVYAIEPGTLYALDGHERHVLRAYETLRMVCVFNPPCTGREVHGPDGAYPPPPQMPWERE
ncbi:MAG: ectoine synthase [Myxococcota bacterium]